MLVKKKKEEEFPPKALMRIYIFNYFDTLYGLVVSFGGAAFAAHACWPWL